MSADASLARAMSCHCLIAWRAERAAQGFFSSALATWRMQGGQARGDGAARGDASPELPLALGMPCLVFFLVAGEGLCRGIAGIDGASAQARGKARRVAACSRKRWPLTKRVEAGRGRSQVHAREKSNCERLFPKQLVCKGRMYFLKG